MDEPTPVTQSHFHVVRRAVERALAGSVADPAGASEAVMAALDELRVVSYQRKDRAPLLNVAGRTLIALLENPQATIREISVRVGVSESHIQKAMTNLVRDGVVERSKRGGRNYYVIQAEALFSHPDLARLAVAVAEFASNDKIEGSEGAE